MATIKSSTGQVYPNKLITDEKYFTIGEDGKISINAGIVTDEYENSNEKIDTGYTLHLYDEDESLSTRITTTDTIKDSSGKYLVRDGETYKVVFTSSRVLKGVTKGSITRTDTDRTDVFEYEYKYDSNVSGEVKVYDYIENEIPLLEVVQDNVAPVITVSTNLITANETQIQAGVSLTFTVSEETTSTACEFTKLYLKDASGQKVTTGVTITCTYNAKNKNYVVTVKAQEVKEYTLVIPSGLFEDKVGNTNSVDIEVAIKVSNNLIITPVTDETATTVLMKDASNNYYLKSKAKVYFKVELPGKTIQNCNGTGVEHKGSYCLYTVTGNTGDSITIVANTIKVNEIENIQQVFTFIEYNSTLTDVILPVEIAAIVDIATLLLRKIKGSLV